ncbi:MAG: hypothetical protein Ta2A_05680 [Treponemataceae bacterium]|nr:MAG: hypothetical protein Ta2A_05680 [Treponemataceae bacterium]
MIFPAVTMTNKRYEHSRRVEQTALRLCKKFGMDKDADMEEKVFFAAVAHDLCKELSDSQLLESAKKDGQPISENELAKPSLLHGRACAVQLVEKYGLTESADAEILEAVREHTYGKKGMGIVAQIVYIADKIEPGRPQIDACYQEKIKDMTLPELLRHVVAENIAFLQQEGKIPAPRSLELLESLNAELDQQFQI